MSQREELPYQALGQRLRAVRQKLQESLNDVSGAVEIEPLRLERIEQGFECPSEDILELLIRHFDIQSDEAAGLWQLAGYEMDCDHDHTQDLEDLTPPQTHHGTIMIMALDPRVVYSDHVQVTANPNGVVLNFAQTTNMLQPLTAARVGMSRKQAKQVMHAIQEALIRSQPRRLPQPKQTKPQTKQPPQKRG